MTRLETLRRRLRLAPAGGAITDDKDMRMTTAPFTTIARVPTDSGSKYLQQLCKHWSHNLAVEFTPEHGTIVFPKDARGADFPGDAVVTFDAADAALDVRIDASVAEQRDHLKGVVARHLDRFAFREAPLPFDWQDA